VPARTQPLLEREILEGLYFDQGLSLHKIAKAVPYSLVRDSFRAHGLKWRSEAMTGIVRSPETRAKISAARTGKKDKVARTPAYRAKMSRIVTQRLRTTGAGFLRGYYESPKAGRVFYMSLWELFRFQELDGDPDVLMSKPQPCSIPYPWEGTTKHYTPDILVIYEGRTPELEEIKPRRVIENDKLNTGRRFAHSRGWTFKVTDQNL
jgi:hypothetical protein